MREGGREGGKEEEQESWAVADLLFMHGLVQRRGRKRNRRFSLLGQLSGCGLRLWSMLYYRYTPG